MCVKNTYTHRVLLFIDILAKSCQSMNNDLTDTWKFFGGDHSKEVPLTLYSVYDICCFCILHDKLLPQATCDWDKILLLRKIDSLSCTGQLVF